MSDNKDRVRALSRIVYLKRLGAKEAARFAAEHGPDGEDDFDKALDRRAASYDVLTVAHLEAIEETGGVK